MDITISIIIIIGLLLLLKGIVIVRQSTVKIVELLGKYHSTLSPGIHVIVPFFAKVRKTVDMRETMCDFRAQTIITKDNVQCMIDGVGFFKILSAEKAIYSVSDYFESISQLMQTNLRNIFGRMTLDEAQTSRNEISQTIIRDLNQITEQWGILITNVEIQSITPPPAILDAMAMEMEAERKKRSLILESEGEKAAIITKAEAHNRKIIIEAEAAKQQEILAAEAAAEAQRITAEAQKTAMMELDSYLADKDNVRQFVVTMSYLQTLRSMGEGEKGKTVFMPFEASRLMSSLGMLNESASALEPRIKTTKK